MPCEMPELGVVKVASPCLESWATMRGDDAVRFCDRCKLNVYNLSVLTSDEARALIKSREGSRLCVRFWERTDGTVITRDCPEGLARARRRRYLRRLGAVAAALTALLHVLFSDRLRWLFGNEAVGALAYDPSVEQAPAQSRPVMGKTMKSFGQNNEY